MNQLKNIDVRDQFYVEDEVKKMNIYERMMMVEKELGVVAKNLEIKATKTSSYRAVSERDVIDAVKPLEAKYRIYSYPYSRVIIKDERLENKRDYGGTEVVVTSTFMRTETVYRFVNVDVPTEYVDITTYGDGIDTGDKATGKAMTYADKYALMKAYKISTGDDPDQEKSPDEGYKVTQRVEPKATPKQIGFLEKLMSSEELDSRLQAMGMNKETMTMKVASDIINEVRNGRN